MTVKPKIISVFILLFLSSVNCQSKCNPVSDAPPCVCAMSDGKMIDLRSLARNDKTAAFSNITGQNTDTYSYNPCYSFTDGECENVAGCQHSTDNRSLGTQDKAEFNTNDKGTVSITYSGGKNGRCMIVNLVCSEKQKVASMIFAGEINSNQYTFTLTTECACPGRCNGGGGGKGQSNSNHKKNNSSKIGFIMLSVLAVFLVVYFVAGMIITRVKYEKTGTDIYLSTLFWISPPLLLKDGLLYICATCIHYFERRSKGYSNI